MSKFISFASPAKEFVLTFDTSRLLNRMDAPNICTMVGDMLSAQLA
jgi:hypothetical protein